MAGGGFKHSPAADWTMGSGGGSIPSRSPLKPEALARPRNETASCRSLEAGPASLALEPGHAPFWLTGGGPSHASLSQYRRLPKKSKNAFDVRTEQSLNQNDSVLKMCQIGNN